MAKLKAGDRVIISSNLDKTDRAHSVVITMREMVGKIYPIEKVIDKGHGSPPTIFVDSYMFHPDDLIPYKKPKPHRPVTFNPEQLNI